MMGPIHGYSTDSFNAFQDRFLANHQMSLPSVCPRQASLKDSSDFCPVATQEGGMKDGSGKLSSRGCPIQTEKWTNN